VYGSSSTDVWYVGGETGGMRGVVLRDDGTTVTEVTEVTATSSSAFFKVQGFGADAVWMVAQNGKTVFWDGATYSEPPTGTRLPLMGLHGTRGERVYAVGGVADGVILSWNG